MKAFARLMQDTGVKGPAATIEIPDDREGQDKAALAWAAAQTGHPWDSLTIEYQSALDWVCRAVKQPKGVV